ncbi:MAG: FimV/HubP family polar landmark protein [Pseudomonas sp.]
MVRKLVLAVAAASALMSSNMVQALGVGEISLRSALNQPLDAEIELLQIRDLSSTEIRSVLASPDDFGKAGIDRSFFLTDLTFTPVVQPDGKAYIKVTSNRPVKEPYLNFLMEVRWPSGRVLREFTLLLDPPLYDPTPVTFSAPVAPPTTSTSGAVRPPVTTPSRTSATAPAAASVPRATQTSAPASSNVQRRTTRADTLWAIALETRPQGSSVHQTMLAIQDLNPNAFIGNNINNLKADQTLALPTTEQAAVRSQAEAIAEISNQTRAWQSRQPAAEPAQRQLDARERSVAGDAPSQTRGEDSLRLVAGSEDSSDDSVSAAGGQNGELRHALDQTKEQLDSTERAKAELADRLAYVEGQLETLQRLLTLKDAQLAALQRELADEGTLPDILPVPEDGVVAEGVADTSSAEDEALQLVAEQPVEAETLDELNAKVAPEDSYGQDGSQDAGENDEEQLALAAVAVSAEQTDAGSDGDTLPAAPQTPAPLSTPVAPQAQPQAEQNSGPEALLQRFMQNQTLLLGTGAVALLALLLVLMSIARRNARREAEVNDNYLAQNTAAGGVAADEGDDFNVALADVQEEAGLEQDVQLDPLGEAEELLSYGELDQAAVVLEAAIQQEPERTDLRLKMMEIEARRENQTGYAAQLEALRSMGVAESAVEMMNARYPLMAAGLMTGAALFDTAAESDAEVDENVLAQPLLDNEQSLDEPSLLKGDSTDFDFADFGLEEGAAASLADSTDQDIGFDLDFDLDESTPAEVDHSRQAEAADAAAELEMPDLSLSESPLTDPVIEDDFSLSLDDELQADNLLAEFEALSQADEPAPQPDVAELDLADDSFSLTDDDLAGFEAQLQTAMQSEYDIDSTAARAGESGDVAGFDNPVTVSEDLMSEGLDEDFDFLSDTDECATKLDLARAYIDMGDEEGARDILTEVVEEGNDQQQQDARELMGQLG